MKYKIILSPDLSLEELQSLVQNGAKFIAFPYAIGLLALTIRRISSAYLVKDKSQLKKMKIRFYLINSIFGWWSLPRGPYFTLKFISDIHNNGIDMTSEIMLNMNEKSINDGEIDYSITEIFFTSPDKFDLKACKKAVKNGFDRNPHLIKLVAGLCVNTEHDEKPYITIGINSDKDFELMSMEYKKSLYKYFRADTRIEVINLKSDNELSNFLEKQASIIFEKNKSKKNEW